MEDHVKKYVENIRNYHSRPETAIRAARRLADDIKNGRLENWRQVRSAVWLVQNAWRPIDNAAVVLFDDKLWDYLPDDLDAARERYLSEMTEYRNRHALCTGTWEDIDHQDPTYWESRNGDLSDAGRESEEKFE